MARTLFARVSAALAGNTLVALTILASAGALRAQTPASFRVLLGVTDTSSIRWDGTVSASQAGNFKVEGWRLETVDAIGGNVFHLSTRVAHGGIGPVVPNGIIVTADAVTGNSEFAITTAQGDFSFRASDVPYGRGIYKLDGRVYIDRIPAAARLTDTPDEEDYPAMATGANGDIWLAYVKFRHSPDYLKLRLRLQAGVTDFKQYAQPTGGDQIWARKYTNGAWGQPIAITRGGGDLYRAAVAVDGSGRAWIFWSENHGGNFDIFARAVDDSGPKSQIQISKDAGSDIDPVAATDASGSVWVAWQGWRGGRAAIFASSQKGAAFTAPQRVSNSIQNEWDPAIAADKTGRVTVAWDSYRNGNYDVYARTWSSGAWGSEVPIAATERYEAYPSIAYDPTGRLWIAYEEGGKGWGKDWGAYAVAGVALYQGRVIRLRGLEPDGRLVKLNASLDNVLMGTPSARPDLTGKQSEAGSYDPNPSSLSKRQPDGEPSPNPQAAKNTLPRLIVDASGRIWLAFRTAHPVWLSPIGTVWTEELVSFDGKAWSEPIFLNHSDNILDNRPALAPEAAGKLLIVNSSDGRRNLQVSEALWNYDQSLDPNAILVEPYNNDLWSHEVDLGPASQAIPVSELPSEATAASTVDSG
jgi:hypothetical protein